MHELFIISYPGCCVTTGKPLICPSRDVDQLTANFINDIHSRMPSLCGQQITFSKKPLTVLNVLQPVPLLSNGTQYPNTKPALVSRPYTKPVLGKPNLPPIIRADHSQMVPDGNKTTMPHQSCTTDAAVPSYNPHSSSSAIQSMDSNQSVLLNKQPSTIVPNFKPIGKPHNNGGLSSSTNNPSFSLNKQPNTIVPSFKSKPHHNGVSSSSTSSVNKRPALSSLSNSLPISKRVCNNERLVTNSHLVPSMEDENDFNNSSTWSNTTFEHTPSSNTKVLYAIWVRIK